MQKLCFVLMKKAVALMKKRDVTVETAIFSKNMNLEKDIFAKFLMKNKL